MKKNKLSNYFKLLFFGDSLTAGWMVDKNYASFLSEMIEQEFQNIHFTPVIRGIPGDTAQAGLSRIFSDLMELYPSCAIIQLGINDALSGVSIPEFRKAYCEILEIILNETECIPLVTSSSLSSIESYNTRLNLFYEELQSLTEEKNIVFAPVHKTWADVFSKTNTAANLLLFDGIHPTEQGHLLMAKAIFPFIRQIIISTCTSS